MVLANTVEAYGIKDEIHFFLHATFRGRSRGVWGGGGSGNPPPRASEKFFFFCFKNPQKDACAVYYTVTLARKDTEQGHFS